MFEDRPGLAHDSSPDTSREAAHKLVNSGQKRRTVFECIARSFDRGITADQLEVVTGWDGNTVRPRVRELMDSGLVEYDDRTETTRKGRQAHVIVLTEQGIDLALEIL